MASRRHHSEESHRTHGETAVAVVSRTGALLSHGCKSLTASLERCMAMLGHAASLAARLLVLYALANCTAFEAQGPVGQA